MAVAHDEGSVAGQGCDDEFEFALALLLDGFETSTGGDGRPAAPSPELFATGAGGSTSARSTHTIATGTIV